MIIVNDYVVFLLKGLASYENNDYLCTILIIIDKHN